MSPVNQPLRNCVHADGNLIATHARGTLMGNRGGQFHDPVTQTIKKRVPWAGKQWISCILQFKGRRRTVWRQGYTELFFLDEVTALSAGHRPCFECRRDHAKAFQSALFGALGKQQGWEKPPKVAVIDALLHEARLQTEPRHTRLGDLPPGAVFRVDDGDFAKTAKGTKLWTIEGYGQAEGFKADGVVQVLTPAPIVAALAYGYQPNWHPSEWDASVESLIDG